MANPAKAFLVLQMIDKLSGPTAKMQRAVSAFSKAAAAFYGFKTLTQPIIEFEDALANVSKSTRLSGEPLDKLGKELRELSHYIPKTAVELANIAAEAGGLDIPAEKLVSFTADVAKIATVFNMEVNQTAQMLKKMQVVTKMPLGDIKKLSDQITVLGEAAGVSEEKIMQFQSKVFETAKDYGIKFEESAAVGAQMMKTLDPKKATSAYTTFINKLSTLSGASKEAKKSLAAAGVNVKEITTLMDQKRGTEAMLKVLDTIEKLPKSTWQANVLKDWMGEGLVDEMQTLLGHTDEIRKNIKAASDSSAFGATEDKFAKRNQSTASRMKLFNNALNDVKMTLGEGLLPALNALLKAFTPVLNSFSAFIGRYPKITAGIMTLIAASSIIKSFKRIADILDVAKSWKDWANWIKNSFVSKIAMAVAKFLGLDKVIKTATLSLKAFLATERVSKFFKAFDIGLLKLARHPAIQALMLAFQVYDMMQRNGKEIAERIKDRQGSDGKTYSRNELDWAEGRAGALANTTEGRRSALEKLYDAGDKTRLSRLADSDSFFTSKEGKSMAKEYLDRLNSDRLSGSQHAQEMKGTVRIEVSAPPGTKVESKQEGDGLGMQIYRGVGKALPAGSMI